MKSVLVALVLLVSTVAFAQPDQPKSHDRGPGRHPQARLMERLKLTPEQEKNIHALRTDMQKKQIDLRAKIQKDRIDLANLMRQDQPEKATIESKQKEINSLQGEAKLNRTDFWFAVNSMLTPDQQKEWKMVPQFMMHRMRQHRGGMMMRGGGMKKWRQNESFNDEGMPGDDDDAGLLPPDISPEMFGD